MYPENQAAGIAANRYGEMMCQAAEDLGYDNDICGYARISLAYAAGVRVARKFDPETGEYIIDPSTGKPLKDENGNVVIDEATGKPKKDPKTQTPYLELVNILELEKAAGWTGQRAPHRGHLSHPSDADPAAGFRSLLQQHL